jgi:hypothetical protein
MKACGRISKFSLANIDLVDNVYLSRAVHVNYTVVLYINKLCVGNIRIQLVFSDHISSVESVQVLLISLMLKYTMWDTQGLPEQSFQKLRKTITA